MREPINVGTPLCVLIGVATALRQSASNEADESYRSDECENGHGDRFFGATTVAVSGTLRMFQCLYTP